jgi:peptidoglycan/xylan/chitin deacetylase (PgdA/CDA1 family)
MRSRELVFLMYHELERPGRPTCQAAAGYVRYVVPEFHFRDQMLWLRSNGWRGMSVGEALTFPKGPGLAITFDDGCETDLLVAAPLLKQIGSHATFFVTTGFLGKSGYMSISQLRELAALNFEIGCHSLTHAYLCDLDDKGLHREIVESKSRLEQILGTIVTHFSCPGGRYDLRTARVVKDAGYRSMSTSRIQRNSSSTDPFGLGRIAVLRDSTPSAFQAICEGRGLWKSKFRAGVQDAAKGLLGNSVYDRVRGLLIRDA